MTDERKHAVLSASGSKRWMACPGSALESLKYPKQASSKYADEGTLAHSMAEKILKGETIRVVDYPSNMFDHVKVYTDYVMRKVSPGDILLVEERFHLDWIHEGMFGTNDACIKKPLESIEIIDLKYGAGVKVSPVDNSQLLYYALGAAYDNELGGLDMTYEKVIMTIVQPRIETEEGFIHSYTIPIEHLAQFAVDLQNAAKLAMSPNAPFASGDHCKWCPCAHACPQLIGDSKALIAAEFDDLPVVNNLTEDQIVKILTHESKLQTLIDACKDYAFTKLSKGEKIEGLKLVRGRGSRVWNRSEEELEQILLKELLPCQIYESGIKSVAQIEKVYGKKNIEELVEKKEGKLQVAPASDRREAVTTVSLDEFETIEADLLD